MKKVIKFIKERLSFLTCWYLIIGCSLSIILDFIFKTSYINTFSILSVLILFMVIYFQEEINNEKLSKEIKRSIEKEKEIYEQYRSITDMIKIDMELLNGYKEDLIENVSYYSKMVENEVEADVANTIDEFIDDLDGGDTIFLIGVNHNKAIWKIRMAGKPIYYTQLNSVMEMLSKHFREIAEPDGFIIYNGIEN